MKHTARVLACIALIAAAGVAVGARTGPTNR